MTITEDGYLPDSEVVIYERLREAFELQFNTTVVPGTVVDAILRSEAAVLAEHQEQALRKVWESAYLAEAEGEELGKLVEMIGLERREAIPATGVTTMGRDSPPAADYVVPGGTTIQTAGTDPVQFETQETGSLYFIDGFEDGSVTGWYGDTGSVTAQSAVTLVDEYTLELPATAGVSIYQDDLDLSIGTTFEQHLQVGTDGIYGFRFGRQDSTNYYEVEVNAYTSEIILNIVEDDAIANSSTNSLTVPTDTSLYLEIQWDITGDIIATLWDSPDKSTEHQTVTITDDTKRFLEGGIELVSKGAYAKKYVDNLVTTETAVNIEGVEGGVESNVAPNTITIFEARPSGFEYVTNTLPTGDLSYSDTTDTIFVQGRDREDDDELRSRAYESTSIGGAATVNALETELARLDSVSAVKIFQNKTNIDNTDSGGLPAKSFEIAVHGGVDEEVAQAIFETKSVDSQDYAGAYGTARSFTVSSDVLSDAEIIEWSEIPEISLDITLDLVVADNYIGDEAIQSRIVQYIGGTDVDGAELSGLDVSDDVFIGVLKDVVIGPSDTGVYDITSYTIDRDGDGTDDTETDSNGATVLSISDSEVAVTNGRDGSIEITTTLM